MMVQSLTFEGPFSQTLTVDYQIDERSMVPTIVRVSRFQQGTHQDITEQLKPDELRWITGYVVELTS